MSQPITFNSGGRTIPLSAQTLTPIQRIPSRRPAILFLHGSGGNIDFWSGHLAAMLQEAGVHLFAPHYFERTATKRADLALITDGIHVPQWLETIDDALRFVSAQPTVDPARIVVAGISLGAFLGLALAAQLSSGQTPGTPSRIRAIVDVSGGLVPPYDTLATHLFPPTLILHGAADTVVPSSFATGLAARLTTLRVPHRAEVLPNEGHWFSASAMPRLLSALSEFLQPLLA